MRTAKAGVTAHYGIPSASLYPKSLRQAKTLSLSRLQEGALMLGVSLAPCDHLGLKGLLGGNQEGWRSLPAPREMVLSALSSLPSSVSVFEEISSRSAPTGKLAEVTASF